VYSLVGHSIAQLVAGFSQRTPRFAPKRTCVGFVADSGPQTVFLRVLRFCTVDTKTFSCFRSAKSVGLLVWLFSGILVSFVPHELSRVCFMDFPCISAVFVFVFCNSSV
jgi:hypothetical protein